MERDYENISFREASQQYAATWSGILIKQHLQLIQEIENVSSLLPQTILNWFLLDAKIKRLIKGVKVHLELENTFLSTALSSVDISQVQKKQLIEGYNSLQNTCDKTMTLVRTLMLFPDKEKAREEYVLQVRQLLDELSSRLKEEDVIYSFLNLTGVNNV
ncbi:hypothetical protein G3488_15350 [Shewanella baltica]|uniref:hypothetical protein n=1 Tax=Shewanella TaxID=22 RepID=UPI0020101D55|nr:MULTISPECIES: hypothetical protein [Shewanella]MCL1089891.1 hypothetical protein [Shewanella profunda]MCS6232231.1 hypothetical protein [Shewanella baltica]MCU8082135.1 hypothetical protein [Shewanella sp. SM23]